MKNKQQLVSENPFYGLENLFSLYNNGVKGSISSFISKAWDEAKSNDLFRKLFHIICFGIGDITNRKHNIFQGQKVDDGGNSANTQWLEYLTWLIKNDVKQFINFLPLIIEYVGLRELTSFQVKTVKGKKTTTSTWGLLQLIQQNKHCYDALINLLVLYIKGNNPFKKHLVAKFVKVPRTSKRIRKDKAGNAIGKRDLQDATKNKMKVYDNLVSKLSEAMGWEVVVNDSYTSYVGYRAWQKQYNSDLEYVLFATKKIKEFDKEQFINWLNRIPASARYRVRRRLLDGNDKDKGTWKNLAKWFLSWEEDKKKLQNTQRELQDKVTKGTITAEEKIILEKVKKDAKVTTGAKTLFDEIEQLVAGKASEITLESIFNKINFDVKVRVIADYSGSMNGRPKSLAAVAATAALLKSQSDYDLLIGFSSDYKIWSGKTSVKTGNRFMSGKKVTLSGLIDKKDSFIQNFKRVYAAYLTGTASSTNIRQVSIAFKDWVDAAETPAEKQSRIEEICSAPVLLLISDGDLNCDPSPGGSLSTFKMNLKQWFGYEPVIVVWNIPKYGEGSKDKYFKGMENVIHVTTYNLSTINQIFTKIGDLDIIDVYTPLKSLYESNRYDLVKTLTI